MSLMMVTMEEMVKEWEAEPTKLLAFILSLLWQSGITPQDSITWIAKDGEIRITSLQKELHEVKQG